MDQPLLFSTPALVAVMNARGAYHMDALSRLQGTSQYLQIIYRLAVILQQRSAIFPACICLSLTSPIADNT
jgi:hypothetical protein